MAWERRGIPIYTLGELCDVNRDAWLSAARDAWDVYLAAETLAEASALDSRDGYGYCAEGCPVGAEDQDFDLLDNCHHLAPAASASTREGRDGPLIAFAPASR